MPRSTATCSARPTVGRSWPAASRHSEPSTSTSTGKTSRHRVSASSTWSTGAWPSPATAPPTSTSRRLKSRPWQPWSTRPWPTCWTPRAAGTPSWSPPHSSSGTSPGCPTRVAWRPGFTTMPTRCSPDRQSAPATEGVMTHELIASAYPEGHLVVRPGYEGAIRIGAGRYAELRYALPDATLPSWLAEAARAGWGIDLADRPAAGTVLVRPESAFGYARASYELNLGCNYDCEHCYLGEKLFAGMDWPGRERLLAVMAEAGVLWLQLTGGEPLIDPLFPETHAAAWDIGMMIQISSNGSRLDRPKILDLLRYTGRTG